MKKIYGPYYHREETQTIRYARQRSGYRVYFENHWHESRHWQLCIQDIFRQMADQIRKE